MIEAAVLCEKANELAAELATVELPGASLGEPLQRRGEIAHDDALARPRVARLAVDRAALGSVSQDEVEDRVQVRLLRGQLHALAGQVDRGLEQPAPGEGAVSLVRSLQPGDGPGNGTGAGPDQIDHL